MIECDEGIAVAGEQPWFKVWSKASLGSTDLLSLTDHEERVWWRLLCVAATQEERWRITLSWPVLARLCASTPPRLSKALATFRRQQMVEIGPDGVISIVNWQRYQETPQAARMRRLRAKQGVTQGVTSSVTVTPDVTVEVTGEEEEEEEEDLTPTLRSGVSGAAKPPPRPRSTPKPNRLKPLTDDLRAAIMRDFPDIPDIEAEIAYAMSYQTKATDTNLYLRRWMRTEREKHQRNVNGNQVQRSNQTRNGHRGRDVGTRDPDLERVLERARREDIELERATAK